MFSEGQLPAASARGGSGESLGRHGIVADHLAGVTRNITRKPFMRFLLLCGLILLQTSAGSADAWRTFTDIKGRKVEAKVIRVESDSVLVELQANGKQLPIELKKLSQEDVEFLHTYYNFPNGAVAANEHRTPDGEPKAGHLYPKTREEIRAGIRDIQKQEKPEGISKEVHEATIQLNIYRFLCGVPHEVLADPEFSKNAEDAALACKKHGSLSHGIGHSTDKCNLSTVGSVKDSVAQYIEDSGDNNRDARGHREWCLNSAMGKVGFGSGGDSYSAMWCMDGSGKRIRGIWTYPGRGLFPLEYMHGNAWSLYGAGKAESAEKLKVEVFRLPKRPENTLPQHGEIDGRVIKVNHVSLGMGGINFEPEEPAKRGVYWVRVNGGGISEGYLVELF
jgi:hypothetical protein